MAKAARQLEPRWRFPHAGPEAFGPGKADLLGFIASTGSIRRAAAELGMSYQRAWNLVQQMNRVFRSPLVEMARGGGTGGGAVVTVAGQEVLGHYREMERRALAAAEPSWRALRGHLR